jgi:hypothetical protein
VRAELDAFPLRNAITRIPYGFIFTVKAKVLPECEGFSAELAR